MDVLWLAPTLPDPYAANFDISDLIGGPPIGPPIGLMGVVLTWAGGTSAVGIGLSIGVAGSASSATILPPQVLTLLDLSTNSGLFGVQIQGSGSANSGPASLDTGFDGLSLAVADTAVAVFALPALSWEPMVDDTGSVARTLQALPATDGEPTLIKASGVSSVMTQTLVPIEPEAVLLRTIGNVAAGASFSAQFSLPAQAAQPFGIQHQVRRLHESADYRSRPWLWKRRAGKRCRWHVRA
jgi:hypothetical protein